MEAMRLRNDFGRDKYDSKTDTMQLAYTTRQAMPYHSTVLHHLGHYTEVDTLSEKRTGHEIPQHTHTESQPGAPKQYHEKS
jgi:hypothetical protein